MKRNVIGSFLLAALLFCLTACGVDVDGSKLRIDMPDLEDVAEAAKDEDKEEAGEDKAEAEEDKEEAEEDKEVTQAAQEEVTMSSKE